MNTKGKKDKKGKVIPNQNFDWELCPDLERFINEKVNLFLDKNNYARMLSERMLNETSTRFIDWIDHIVLPESEVNYEDLLKIGLQEVKGLDAPKEAEIFRHEQSYLFPILLSSESKAEIALKPENIEDFVQMIGSGAMIEGAPFAPFRKTIISTENDVVLSAVERRGYNGFIVRASKDVNSYVNALDRFLARKRYFESDEEGMGATEELIAETVRKLRSERVADAFFRSERGYWERRNRAGQMQKARQDRLGLGWGNHDHHTYRSSRVNFINMVRIFEKMGYTCREKYYAGENAGWGAQILEHKICNIVVFTDVDLWPEETTIDFAHQGLPKRKVLGTVGLWVGLHGESILQAGMHHLEARFNFERLKTDLGKQGVTVMPPFSYFDFLKQAFTAGELWPVDKRRLDKLLADGSITQQQYEKFKNEGAIGSHMENLERDQGFKGFNKSSVTKIIKATDPRKQGYSGA